MRNRILPYQIEQIITNDHRSLHHEILGVDVSARHIAPVSKGIYYVDVHDPMGKILVEKSTPAICLYDTGEIFCLYDKRIPLTQSRLIHEFLHRAARRRHFFHYVSGLDTLPKHTYLNECITEYLTMRIMGDIYYDEINPNNRYLSSLESIRHLEEKKGLLALVKAYLNGKRRFFNHAIKASSNYKALT